MRMEMWITCTCKSCDFKGSTSILTRPQKQKQSRPSAVMWWRSPERISFGTGHGFISLVVQVSLEQTFNSSAEVKGDRTPRNRAAMNNMVKRRTLSTDWGWLADGRWTNSRTRHAQVFHHRLHCEGRRSLKILPNFSHSTWIDLHLLNMCYYGYCVARSIALPLTPWKCNPCLF